MFELNFVDITKPFTLTYSVLRHLNKIASPSDDEYLTTREIEFEEEVVDYLTRYNNGKMPWADYCSLWTQAFDTSREIADIFRDYKKGMKEDEAI